VLFAPDGRLMVSSGGDSPGRIWDVKTGRPIAGLPREGWAPTVVAIALNGKRLLTAVNLMRDEGWNTARSLKELTVATTARLWELPSGRLQATLKHQDWVSAAGFSPDNRLLATGTTDGAIFLWEVVRPERGERLSGSSSAPQTGPDTAVRALAFTPDGQTLVTTGEDGIARLWDVSQRRLRAILTGHSGMIFTLALSPDGQLLATGGSDGMVRLWAVSSGNLTAVRSGHTGSVVSLNFSPDGALLASGSSDKTVRVWKVPHR
jgi:WD40 repeat protein